MSSETKLIVVCTQQNHPTGKRNRAGLTFTEAPQAFEVTAEQEALIRADECLRVIEKGTARQDAVDTYEKKTQSSAPSEPSADSVDPASTPSDLIPTPDASTIENN